jgi:hypothetical protein
VKDDRLQHSVQIGEGLVVPEPKHVVAVGLEKGSASLVRIALNRMLAAVELDD